MSNLHVCPICKGTCKQTITVSSYVKSQCETSEIMCIHCDGRGMVNKNQLRSIRFGQNMWCECEGESSPIYHTDGRTPWKWCVTKHHYHCANCKKLVQIG